MSISQHIGHFQERGEQTVLGTRAALEAIAAANALHHHDVKSAVEHGIDATENAAMAIAENSKILKTAGHIAEKMGLKGGLLLLKVGSREVPLAGAVVGFGFGAVEVGTEAWKMAQHPPQSNWQKLASATASAVAQTAGGLIGFGAGEALQEGVHYATSAVLGKENAADHAATVELAMLTTQVATEVAAEHHIKISPEAMYANATQAAQALATGQVASGVTQQISHIVPSVKPSMHQAAKASVRT